MIKIEVENILKYWDFFDFKYNEKKKILRLFLFLEKFEENVNKGIKLCFCYMNDNNG